MGINAQPDEISIASGGIQTMRISAGGANVFAPYLVLGSISGTTPFPIGGFTLPLSIDFYTTYTLSSPNSPPLVGSFGTLDEIGEAKTLFKVNAQVLSPNLIGLTLFHAFLVFKNGQVSFVSAAAPLTLVP